MPEMTLSSYAIEPGKPIPEHHTCEGVDSSPPLSWSGVPDGARSLALILHDPDAPSGDFVHWLAWNIDPGAARLEEGQPAPVEGTNGFGRPGYGGPCPPPGDGPHRYFFDLIALSSELELEAGASREQLEQAMEGQVMAKAEMMGTYERSG
jgi:Raf kinase inhibitor-like YbhB/YbcL family protein